MQPQQGSRLDLGELKAHIANKIGAERLKRYFYYLTRFVNQKLSKSEFDKSCNRLLGRENRPLHNQLILSILKNACQAKTPPPINEVGPTKSVININPDSPITEDGLEKHGSFPPIQNQGAPIWSNGIFPVSPRKSRSGEWDRKPRDRPSLLVPNGKVKCLLHQSMGAEDNAGGTNLEREIISSSDCQIPVPHLPAIAERPQIETVPIEDVEEMELTNQLNLSRTSLIAPLGIPFCPASIGGARKASPATSTGDFISCNERGGLQDSETLRKRMEQITAAHGLGGVSMECANMLSSMLDVFLKRLVKSCVELVAARSAHALTMKHPSNKWPGKNLHMHGSSVPIYTIQEQTPQHFSLSMLDFKVAMELNPRQLGEDWSILLERICMRSFEE